VNLLCLKVEEGLLNSRERISNMSWHSLSLIGVGEDHSKLCHAISLENTMASDVLPFIVSFLGKSSRSRNHKAELLKFLSDLVRSFFHAILLIMGNHLLVDSGYSHEKSEVNAILLV